MAIPGLYGFVQVCGIMVWSHLPLVVVSCSWYLTAAVLIYRRSSSLYFLSLLTRACLLIPGNHKRSSCCDVYVAKDVRNSCN